MIRGVVLIGLVGVSSPALADDWSLHITGAARVGWTDNLFSASDVAAEQPPAKESDEYTQLDPGVLFTWETPRATNELDYTLEANLYAQHTEAWGVTHRGGWRGFFQTTPLSELETSVSLAGGTLNTFSTSSSAATGEIVLMPSAESTFETIDARETFQDEVSRSWRVSQVGIGRVFSDKPSDTGVRTTGYEAGGGFGADRSWQFNAVGVNVESRYVALGGGSSEMITEGSLSWRRDLSQHWSTLIDPGVTILVPLKGGGGTTTQPTIGGQIGYYPTWGAAGLAVRRSVQPNLYIGATTISDTATLNAGLPVHWLGDDENGAPRLGLESTLGYTRSTVIDPSTGAEFSGFQVGAVDVAAAYEIAPQAHVSIRYQLEHQVADPNQPMSLGVRSYDRNTILLSFDGRWPERVAGEVPVRESLRVDRSNVTPIGEEIGGTPAGQKPR